MGRAMQRVVIIGGGAIGSAVAYWLTADPAFTGEVVVVERDPTYREASSALSASSIRQQFSTPVNIEVGRFGIGFLRALGATLQVDGERPDIGLTEPGYLYLATAAGIDTLRANHAVQRAHGADVALLEPGELQRRWPWLATADLAGGSLGLSGEGWFDGYALLRAFRAKAIAQGAGFRKAEAAGLALAGRRVTAVRLADGSELPCDAVVNAAGPWAARVAAMAGIDLPVRARARSVFVLDCPEPLPGCPLLIDPSGFWLRPEGRHFITGAPPRPGEDHDDLPLQPDHGLFEEVIWPALAQRVPALERLQVVGAWAGYYEMNIFDQNGIVGPHPDLANLYFANGFSGHGIQQAPAVGRGLAELIVHGGYRTLDLAPLGFARLLEPAPWSSAMSSEDPYHARDPQASRPHRRPSAADAIRIRHPLNPNSDVTIQRLAERTGMQRLPVSLARVPPGKESFTLHAHLATEEFLYILEGHGTAVIGDAEVAVGPGDFMGFPTDGTPHTPARTPGTTDLVYLMGGERTAVEVARFPAAGKLAVFTMAEAPGSSTRRRRSR